MQRLLIWISYLLAGTAALAAMKHREVIDWTWTAVLAPIWVPVTVVALSAVVIAPFLILGEALARDAERDEKRRREDDEERKEAA